MPPTLRPRSRASDDGRNATPDHRNTDDNTSVPDRSVPPEYSAPVDHTAPETYVAPDGNQPRDSDDLPIELCFHADFEASVRRPLSLHFNDTYLISYERPPPLTVPPPPGVIIDLGRVDALPDDPDFLVLVEEQIHREIEESIQRRQQQERQRVMPRMGHQINRALCLIHERWGLTLAVVFTLLSAMILSSLAPARTKPGLLESDVSIQTIPITQNMTKIDLATTQLCPIILFNAFVYPTIGDAPDTAPLPPHQTLHKSWNITTHLVQKFMLDHFYEQEFKRYWASADSLDTQMRLSSSELWELDSGLRWDDISGIWQRGSEMRHHASSLWFSLADNLFYFWVKGAIVDIGLSCFINQIGVFRLNIDKLEILEGWAVSSRYRNLTLEKSREDEYFWPNQTKYPELFDQIMWLAQLKDAMEHILETSRLVADEIPEETILARLRGWYQTKEGKSKVKRRMDELGQMLQVDMRRQLYDLIVGLEAVRDICHQRDILSASINDLQSVSNWIIDENETGVLLRKLLHPKEQAKELRALSAEMTRRKRELLKYQAMWESMYKEEGYERRNETEYEDEDEDEGDGPVRNDTENEGGIRSYF